MTDLITITVPPELTALLEKLSGADRLKASTDAAKAAGPVLTRLLVEQAQSSAGSGPFASGWLAQPAGPGLSVTNSMGVSAFIEFSTRAHKIQARPGGVLAWVPGRGAFSAVNASKAKAGAGWVFAKSVNHPGTVGKDVFGITIRGKGGDTIFDAMTTEATEYLEGAP